MLAVISCYFDFVGWSSWKRRVEKARDFYMSYGIPFYDTEVGMGLHGVTRSPHYIQATKKNIIWQKEQLWNLIASEIPSRYNKFLFVDADVTFEPRTEWVRMIEKALDDNDVVQPFYSCPRGASYMSFGEGPGDSRGVNGLTWAMTREYWERIGGWYARAGTCWGDMIMCYGVNRRCSQLLNRVSPASYMSIERWAERVQTKRYGHVSLSVLHDEHGTIKGRNYIEQGIPLIAAGFDPDNDLRDGANGLLEWTTEDHFMRESVFRYFKRRGDG